jgi:hypothetical protein
MQAWESLSMVRVRRTTHQSRGIDERRSRNLRYWTIWGGGVCVVRSGEGLFGGFEGFHSSQIETGGRDAFPWMMEMMRGLILRTGPVRRVLGLDLVLWDRAELQAGQFPATEPDRRVVGVNGGKWW